MSTPSLYDVYAKIINYVTWFNQFTVKKQREWKK